MFETAPIPLSSLRKKALVLDVDTIYKINEGLAKLCEDKDLEAVHGRITVEVVKGRFQRLEVAESSLLIDNKQKHQRNIA